MTTVYHFWSPTCSPCKVLAPAIEQMKRDFQDVNWISINIREDPNNYVKKFGIMVVPTIVVESKYGINKQSGIQENVYRQMIQHARR